MLSVQDMDRRISDHVSELNLLIAKKLEVSKDTEEVSTTNRETLTNLTNEQKDALLARMREVMVMLRKTPRTHFQASVRWVYRVLAWSILSSGELAPRTDYGCTFLGFYNYMAAVEAQQQELSDDETP